MRTKWAGVAIALALRLGMCQAPATGGYISPSRPDYRIGNGDVLHVSVWGQDQFTRDAVVRPDGRITLPLIPDVLASGRTVAQTESALHEELVKYVKAPLVTVSVVDSRSKVIYVTGEVLRPGAYVLTEPTSALQLLVRAGGGTDFAKLKKAYVLRGTGERVPVNLKNFLKGKQLAGNISLSAGDTVVIP